MSSARLLVLLLTLISLALHGQVAPPITWEETYGGSDDEMGRDLLRTSDHGYVIAGFTYSNNGDVSGQHGDRDLWAFKIDSVGTVQWQQTLGNFSWDEAHDVCATLDGGYVLTGITAPAGVQFDAWVVKLDSAGDVDWDRVLSGSAHDGGRSSAATSDGGSIMIGETESDDGDASGNHGARDVWVVKLDDAGDIQWQHCYGGGDIDGGTDIVLTPDGGYAFVGTVLSNNGDVPGTNHGLADCWLVKLDPAGDIQWQKTYGGSYSETFWAMDITSDGGYILCGNTSSFNGDVSGHIAGDDAWVVKVDAAGDLEWQHCYGGTTQDHAIDIEQLPDGGYLFSGNSNSTDVDVVGAHGGADGWLVRLDPSGNLIWQRPLGGSDEDAALAVELLPEGRCMVSGSTQSNDGDIEDFIGVRDVWLIRFGEGDWSSGLPEPGPTTELALSPNPGDGWYRITGNEFDEGSYTVHDGRGELVKSGSIDRGQHELDLRALRSGIYLLTLRSASTARSLRLVRE